MKGVISFTVEQLSHQYTTLLLHHETTLDECGRRHNRG